MSTIEQMLQKLCPDGVEFRKLGEITTLHKGNQFNKRDMLEEGTYPVINGGINPSGYAEISNEEANTITISQGGASAGYVNWLDKPFYAGAHCYVLKPQKELNNRYLYFFMKTKERSLMASQYGAGIPALSQNDILSLDVPVPPLSVQREIVRVLDAFTELEAELEAELDCRKRQYEYYRNQLLTFANGGGYAKRNLDEDV